MQFRWRKICICGLLLLTAVFWMGCTEVKESKGGEMPETIYIQPMLGTVARISDDGKKRVVYGERQLPDLKQDTLYLLCLDESDIEGVYYLGENYSDSAVVLDGITYPRYNTEYHPFYKQSLEELRKID